MADNENKQVITCQPVPYDIMEKMAKAFATGKLFGFKTEAEAMSIMLIAQAEGHHPAIAARDYNVILGKPALKADAMLARFQEAGGKVKWTSYTDEKVSGIFSHPSGGDVEITWDTERAKKAGLGLKDNWIKWPRQMRRSRCISEGVRTVYPGITIGIYTPEEISDFDNRSCPLEHPTPNMRLDGVLPTQETTFEEIAGKPFKAPPLPQRPVGAGDENGEQLPFGNDNGTLPFVLISEPQRKRLFAIGKKAGKTEEQMKEIVKKYGFEHTRDITRDKYEVICNEIAGRISKWI
jgi:hypothetical protein